jgi:hypothetical protein
VEDSGQEHPELKLGGAPRHLTVDAALLFCAAPPQIAIFFLGGWVSGRRDLPAQSQKATFRQRIYQELANLRCRGPIRE